MDYHAWPSRYTVHLIQYLQITKINFCLHTGDFHKSTVCLSQATKYENPTVFVEHNRNLL